MSHDMWPKIQLLYHANPCNHVLQVLRATSLVYMSHGSTWDILGQLMANLDITRPCQQQSLLAGSPCWYGTVKGVSSFNTSLLSSTLIPLRPTSVPAGMETRLNDKTGVRHFILLSLPLSLSLLLQRSSSGRLLKPVLSQFNKEIILLYWHREEATCRHMPDGSQHSPVRRYSEVIWVLSSCRHSAVAQSLLYSRLLYNLMIRSVLQDS